MSASAHTIMKNANDIPTYHINNLAYNENAIRVILTIDYSHLYVKLKKRWLCTKFESKQLITVQIQTNYIIFLMKYKVQLISLDCSHYTKNISKIPISNSFNTMSNFTKVSSKQCEKNKQG